MVSVSTICLTVSPSRLESCLFPNSSGCGTPAARRALLKMHGRPREHLPTNSRESSGKTHRKFESWHAKICFAERLRLQISFLDCLFPSRPHNVFRVLTQGKQHLSFRRMHMSEVWAPMTDALSTDGKGKDHFGIPSLNYQIMYISFEPRASTPFCLLRHSSH